MERRVRASEWKQVELQTQQNGGNEFGGAIFHDVNSVRLKASCVYVRTH